ncbi:unnamed protein product [Schistosoma margrebowiei]|uniref:Uncharacterized protein n=1 Tax=Schistosoma margrebowiei TaxID=48269 RepID=A0A183LKI4_9TREM|nr:unnamed protein product [Schistosoma margrebowiei]
MQLDDLNFTGDLAALSHTCQHMRMKTTGEAAASESVYLNINRGRIKIVKYNTENTDAIKLDGETLEEVITLSLL